MSDSDTITIPLETLGTILAEPEPIRSDVQSLREAIEDLPTDEDEQAEQSDLDQTLHWLKNAQESADSISTKLGREPA